MIRIATTQAATLSSRRWPSARLIDRLRHLREPGESYSDVIISDVIIRLAAGQR
jgi:hypothetical protein